MHLKNPLLFGLLAILLLGGTITPVLSQSEPELQVIINEIETNPSGSDSGNVSSGSQEFVELYNPGMTEIDISGWSIQPSATWKKLIIPNNTVISPQSFLVFTHVNYWFKDFGETISLIDLDGNIIDQTPLLTDEEDDGNSWQRNTDGYDTDSISDWTLKRLTPKTSNGQIIEQLETTFNFTGQTDKTDYLFGESITISGSISEKLYTFDSSYTAEIIKVSISGPDYYKNLALFPDRSLNFSTTLNIQKVLGFNTGTYDVKLQYGENILNTTFKINDSVDSSSDVDVSEFVSLSTDKPAYIPGELVILSGDTNSLIPYGGLDYTVTDPDGNVVFEGTIFQNEKFSTVHQQGGGQLYAFSTQLYMSTVEPTYGEYYVNGVYKSQNPLYDTSENTLKTSTTFELKEDVKEDKIISLSTDKEIYALGEIIKLTGRSNEYWTESLNLEVSQTGVLSSDIDDLKSQHIRPDPFTLFDVVRVNGDGTFEYEFELVNSVSANESYDHVFGDYKITISDYFGNESVFFKVVEDPESFVDYRSPLGLKTDKSEYVLGSAIAISGRVLDYEHKVTNNFHNYVEFTFLDPQGKHMMSEDRRSKEQANFNYEADSPNDKLRYKAIPDKLGSYRVEAILTPIQFDYGVYTVKATHPFSKITESVQFEIKSAQSDIIPEIEDVEPITLEICKSNRASTPEILRDLKTIGRGEIPPSMESIICSENLNFKVGDKLVVTGKVTPKSMTNLDQSSTKTSGQTQEGHSYSTNYAQSVMNYVEVSIPYPKSMTVSGAASVKTIPNEDENYTGGGGSGEGGSYNKDKDGNVIRPDTHCEVSSAGDCTPTKRSDRLGQGSYDGQIILSNQKLLLTEMNYKAYPDIEGHYATIFELRAGVFAAGTYAVKANYFGYHIETDVTITDNSLKGGSKPEIILNLEKDEYVPGEIVKINGNIENVYYYDTVSVVVETPNVSQINCLVGQNCGFGNTEKKLRVQETVDGAAFTWNYKIPDNSVSVGTYNIVVDTHFGQLEKQFFVVDESEIISQVSPSDEKFSVSSKKLIEKFNRISDNKIPIILEEKSTDDSSLSPRVIQGSLFTSARGEESDVNLRVTTSTNQCVIGQSSDCLVSESTRKPGEIYSVVSIDNMEYKIRYSGNDVRLEKFSIVPVESNSPIDINNWNVEIIKEEQPSRFYYKVSYVALE